MENQHNVKSIEASVIHVYLVEKMKEKFKYEDKIKHSQVVHFLNPYCIPKVLRNKFLKEMETYHLIKRIDKKNIKILI